MPLKRCVRRPNVGVMKSYRQTFATFTALGLTLVSGVLHADQALGPTYPINEPHLLNEIHGALAEKERTGEIARLQKEAHDRSVAYIKAPTPVDGVATTTAPRVFYYDPTFVAKTEVRTPDGEVVISVGQSVNPLNYVALPKLMLFLDGRDPAQVEMGRRIYEQYNGRVKPILVAGVVPEVAKHFENQIFFDQGGSIVRKLGITQVPALVSQDEKRLRIEEMAVPE